MCCWFIIKKGVFFSKASQQLMLHAYTANIEIKLMRLLVYCAPKALGTSIFRYFQSNSSLFMKFLTINMPIKNNWGPRYRWWSQSGTNGRNYCLYVVRQLHLKTDPGVIQYDTYELIEMRLLQMLGTVLKLEWRRPWWFVMLVIVKCFRQLAILFPNEKLMGCCEESAVWP